MQIPLISLALTLFGSVCSSQDSPAAKPAIAIYSGGLEQWLSDPSDAGLLRILGFLDERIMELAEETGGQAPPKPMLDLALEILSAPQALRIGVGDLSQGLTPDILWAQFDVKAKNAEQASGLAARIEGLLGMLPFPLQELPANPDMKFVDVGNGMGVHLGARQAADQSGTYVISWGTPRAADMNLVDLGMPLDSRPLFAMGLDLAQLQGALQVGLSLAGENAETVRRQLERFNILSENAWSLSIAMGVADERLQTNMRVGNWIPLARSMNQFVEQRLSPKDFSMLPADANLAGLQVRNTSAVLDQLRTISAEDLGTSGEEAIAMIEGLLGINLEQDFFSTIGQVQGFYTSESTGGGGLTSGVLFSSIQDEATLKKTMGLLSDKYLGLAQGRARFSQWKHGDVECTTINLPGLPIPVEVSMGFSQGYLFMTLTRGALAAALDNAQSGSAGLLGLAKVQRELPHSIDAALSFSYSDGVSMAKEGYGTLSMVYSALANAALSPSDTEREVGMIMPIYAQLMKRVAPQVLVAWVEGDDLMVKARTSPSLTANLASLLGNPLVKILAPAVLVGLPIGITQRAQRQAAEERYYEDSYDEEGYEGDYEEEGSWNPNHEQVVYDIGMLAAGMELYAVDNDGQYPPNLEALMQGPDGHSYIWTEELPVDPWGFAYNYLVPTESNDFQWLIYSLGSDGESGGYDDEADIDNRMIERGEY